MTEGSGNQAEPAPTHFSRDVNFRLWMPCRIWLASASCSLYGINLIRIDQILLQPLPLEEVRGAPRVQEVLSTPWLFAQALAVVKTILIKLIPYATYTWDADSISVTVVPEPATAGLLGISLGALWLVRRLKKAMNYYRT
jgi:hypothetical protein